MEEDRIRLHLQSIARFNLNIAVELQQSGLLIVYRSIGNDLIGLVASRREDL